MGNLLGRQSAGRRRRKPLVPGEPVRGELFDGDVVVLCDQHTGAPLQLTVVNGSAFKVNGAVSKPAAPASPLKTASGGEGGGPVHYALVRGSPDTLADRGSVFVVERAGGSAWMRLRSFHISLKTNAEASSGGCYLSVKTQDATGSDDRGVSSSDHSRGAHLDPRLYFERRRTRAGMWRAARRAGGSSGSDSCVVTHLVSRVNDAAALTARAPTRVTIETAGRLCARFLETEATEWATLRARLDVLSRGAATARRHAAAELARLRVVDARMHARDTRRTDFDFLDGLTGVVDALRDTVKTASAEPPASCNIARVDTRSPDDGSEPGPSDVDSAWDVDGAHLASVSRVWDMSVSTFRAQLSAHGIDDAPIAALQDAINEQAYQHFVAAGMRRFRLNRKDPELSDTCKDDEDDEEDEDGWSGGGSDGESGGKGKTTEGGSSPARRAAAAAAASASRTRKKASRRTARARATLKARARAREAMVDFRRHKVGSLREQLERGGVDAGPLAMMVHALAHAVLKEAERGQKGRALSARSSGAPSWASPSEEEEEEEDRYTTEEILVTKRTPGVPSRYAPSESASAASETFQTVLARERSPHAGASLFWAGASSPSVGARPGSPPPSCLSNATAESWKSEYHSARPSPSVDTASASPQRHRRGGASWSYDEIRASPLRSPGSEEKWRSTSSENTARGFVEASVTRCGSSTLRIGSMHLRDLREELRLRSMLARGLDECVEALVETEWEDGDEGWVVQRGERVAAMGAVTVDAFRRRLEEHALVGSISELNLLTAALAKALAADA